MAVYILLLCGCISKRRLENNNLNNNISVQILGGQEVAERAAKSSVYMSQCINSKVLGQTAGGDTYLFNPELSLSTGSTCQLEIESDLGDDVPSKIHWLDRQGLLFRDRNVVVSQLPSGVKTGVAKNLERTFDFVESDGKTSILSVKLTMPKGMLVTNGMDASLSCAPIAPYFANLDIKKFSQLGERQTGIVYFHLPQVTGPNVRYACTSVSVYLNRKVVASGTTTGANTFELQTASTNIDFPGEFILDGWMESPNVVILPKVIDSKK